MIRLAALLFLAAVAVTGCDSPVTNDGERVIPQPVLVTADFPTETDT